MNTDAVVFAVCCMFCAFYLGFLVAHNEVRHDPPPQRTYPNNTIALMFTCEAGEIEQLRTCKARQRMNKIGGKKA